MKKPKHSIEDEFEDIAEVEDDSDFPIHEKITKQKKILKWIILRMLEVTSQQLQAQGIIAAILNWLSLSLYEVQELN